MEHKTWTTMDKTGWGPGPWQGEPDKEQWPDPETGLPCLIKRNHFGNLCGYVGVPEGHPWHRKHYDDISPPPEAHGSLTYSGLCQEGPEGETICHVPAPGEPEPLWWLGFDCGHAWDVSPAMEARERAQGYSPLRIPDQTHKTVGYVKAECAGLARQASKAAAAT